MSWHEKSYSMGRCLFCPYQGILRVARYRRELADMILREHICPECGRNQMSIQMMVDPMRLLEMGISPLLSSVRTRTRRATPARSADATAG